jgi:hypothetical protein
MTKIVHSMGTSFWCCLASLNPVISAGCINGMVSFGRCLTLHFDACLRLAAQSYLRRGRQLPSADALPLYQDS